MFGKGDFYILRAKGDSMVDAGIDEDDLLVIERNCPALEDCNGILFLGIQRTKRSKKSPSVTDGGRFLRRSYSPTYSASRSERSFASSFISR